MAAVFQGTRGQIACWLEELQSFNFQVEHRAGARHGNADALSRRPCAEEGCGYCEKRVARERELCEEEGVVAEVSQLGLPGLSGMHVVDINEWREKQEEDSELAMVLQWVQEGRRPSREEWPEAYALPNQEAETIVNALLGGFISRFGVPETIHSDQGRNFESRVFAEMCQRLGVEKTRTTPLHPQSDGLVERFHRTLGQLPLVLMACRSAVQDSTACSPALLMLGRELRTLRRDGVWSAARGSPTTGWSRLRPEATRSAGVGPYICQAADGTCRHTAEKTL
ncbi:hypothetical protein DPEC_G00107750 [Dallia pectoralis]|uniref:Uncharacterized protein n=1 Tax=Dallia pectoralis TaxID=75939 RepID=A0ACC2GSN8_DALPE|nr:hypothetical protein DPEC_G00107750 [Dallia pectoralis]